MGLIWTGFKLENHFSALNYMFQSSSMDPFKVDVYANESQGAFMTSSSVDPSNIGSLRKVYRRPSVDIENAVVLAPSRTFFEVRYDKNWNLTSNFIKQLTSGTKFVYENALVR